MKGLCYTDTWRMKDLAASTSATRRSATGIVATINDVYTFLKFTTEIGDDFGDNKQPSLDTKVWVKDKRIIMFCEKPMSTNLMVQADYALSDEVKASNLAEEIARRLRNTSVELEYSRRLEIWKEAWVKMKTSGHKELRKASLGRLSARGSRVSRKLLEEASCRGLTQVSSHYIKEMTGEEQLELEKKL